MDTLSLFGAVEAEPIRVSELVVPICFIWTPIFFYICCWNCGDLAWSLHCLLWLAVALNALFIFLVGVPIPIFTLIGVPIPTIWRIGDVS